MQRKFTIEDLFNDSITVTFQTRFDSHCKIFSSYSTFLKYVRVTYGSDTYLRLLSHSEKLYFYADCECGFAVLNSYLDSEPFELVMYFSC